jgi:hypothetical protein
MEPTLMTDYNLSWWLGVDVDVTPLSIGVYGHYHIKNKHGYLRQQ